jgi:hypothetical protein
MAFAALAALSTGCMTAYKRQVAAEQETPQQRVYLADYNNAWQAVLDAMKSLRLEVTNREGGYLQTQWTDNTVEKSFIDSFGMAGAVLKARYRFKVTVTRGFYNGQPSVRVSVLKDQVVQRDLLEGWRTLPSDTVEENTLLYRIGRLITIRLKMTELEEEKVEAESESVDF